MLYTCMHHYYIYTSKLHNRSIFTLSDLVNKLNTKYNVENID